MIQTTYLAVIQMHHMMRSVRGERWGGHCRCNPRGMSALYICNSHLQIAAAGVVWWVWLCRCRCKAEYPEDTKRSPVSAEAKL
jgi:hypothetical protein